jgi:N-acetylglucosaminyl-diphospho-decaprenol L-rhamnosyltransferase
MSSVVIDNGSFKSVAASVIVVMYNSASTIEACLRSVPDECEVVLVDQCSSDDSIDNAKSARPDATLIRAGSNRGFGAGCNLGAANATRDVLIFLNPDATLGPHAVSRLVSRVRRENALVGPKIIDEQGRDQTRARYWSRISSDLGEVFLPTSLTRRFLNRDIPQGDTVYRSGGRVPYVQGACMAVRSDDFWVAGGFDERLFLYHEEEVVAQRLRSIGVPVYLEPAAVVTHIGARSTSQVRDFAAGQYYRSRVLCSLTYSPKYVAIPGALALWWLLTIMAILTPLRKVVGLRADKGRSWYRTAAAGVIAGLLGRTAEPPLLQHI